MKQRKNQLIIIIIVLFISGFLVASLTSFFAARSSLRSQIIQSELPLTSDNVYSEIQHDLINPVFISFMMATNTFLRDWALGFETDEEKITRYLKDIQVRNKTVTSFFVSEKTKKYYHADGLLKTINKDEERDKWYFRVREMKPDYEINVDIDMANKDAMTIFVNYKVFDYEGNFIGATGIGLAVDAVKMLIDKYQKRYGRNILIFDRTGNIKLHGPDFNLKTNNIFESKEIAPFEKEILSHDQTAFNYEQDGTTFHFNTRYIPEFKWYLFVEQSEKKAVKAILRALSISLAICIVITILVFILIYRTISSFQKDLETMATTDKLTGINNRRAFDTIIEQTIKEVTRSKEPLSLIIFDIDNFKDTNDAFGHIAGDSVLKNIAKTARGNIRIPDALFRWGGEEFLIILKDCSADDAFDVAEKIRNAVGSSPTLHKNMEIPATISLGVAQYSDEESIDTMLIRIDKALYSAKHNGRDRTEKAR